MVCHRSLNEISCAYDNCAGKTQACEISSLHVFVSEILYVLYLAMNLYDITYM